MKAQHAGLLAAATALLALPFGLTDFWVFISIEVLAFALYAVSFNLLLGYGGMLSFGHAAFLGVGGYTAGLVVKQSGLPPVLTVICLPFAVMFASAATALVVGFFSVRRVGIYFAMLTFAFQMLLYTIALKATPLTGGDDGLTGIKPPGILAQPRAYYYFALALTVGSLYILHRIVSSPFGYTLRALRTNALRVQYLGIDVHAHRLAAFVVSGAFAGSGGSDFRTLERQRVSRMARLDGERHADCHGSARRHCQLSRSGSRRRSLRCARSADQRAHRILAACHGDHYRDPRIADARGLTGLWSERRRVPTQEAR